MKPAAASSRSPASARGFTLLELIVVIGIVVAMSMAVATGVAGVMGVKTKEEVGKIAGSIRAMYGEAALGGSTCRMVFDLDEGSWWPECAQGRVRIGQQEESVRGARVEEDRRDKGGTEEEIAARQQVESRNAFSTYSSNLAKPRTLPEGIFFDGVWTQHQTETYTEGKAFLYFFAHGQTERAYIYVGRGDDIFTVIVNPTTGRTQVKGEKIPVPERELRR